MLVFRSLLFNLVFYINLVLFLVLGFWFMFTPRSWSIAALKVWARSSLWWMRLITGTTMEVRGREHIPQTGGLLAGKHQSAWDIFALLPLLADPALVLKRELTFIPVFGWFCLKFKMISVDRSAGPSALKKMIADAKQAIAAGRQVLIFPEGTRMAPDAAAGPQARCNGSLHPTGCAVHAICAEFRPLLAKTAVHPAARHDHR